MNPTIIHQKIDNLDTNQKLKQNKIAFEEYEEYISRIDFSKRRCTDSDILPQALSLVQISLEFFASHESGVLAFPKDSIELETWIFNEVVSELRKQNDDLYPIILTDSVCEILKWLDSKIEIAGLVNDMNISEIWFLGLGTFAIENSHKNKKLIFFISNEVNEINLTKLVNIFEKVKHNFPWLYFITYMSDEVKVPTDNLLREIAINSWFIDNKKDPFAIHNVKLFFFQTLNSLLQRGFERQFGVSFCKRFCFFFFSLLE